MTIRELRVRAGLTQAEVSKKLRINQAAVSYWESGKTKPLRKVRKRLCKVYGCTADELAEALESEVAHAAN